MSVVLPVSVDGGMEWQRVPVLSQNVAVLHGMWRESVLCVDVQCGKICCFITFFERRALFFKSGPNEKKFIFVSGPILHTAILGKYILYIEEVPEQGTQNAKGPKPASHVCRQRHPRT